MGYAYIILKYDLWFIWNSNLAGDLVFLLAKSGKPRPRCMTPLQRIPCLGWFIHSYLWGVSKVPKGHTEGRRRKGPVFDNSDSKSHLFILKSL